MKTWALVVMVVLLHCAAISALFVLQGCGTPRVREPVEPAVVMPPMAPPDAHVPSVREIKALDTKTYTIRPGDSISRIAQRYNTSQAEIEALNNLADPNKIRVGQKLLLPGYVDLDKPAPRPAPAVTPMPADSGDVYVVQSGDSISTIARRLNVSEDELVKLNELADRNRIRIGQKLLVPASARKPAPKEPERDPWAFGVQDEREPVTVIDSPTDTFVMPEIFHTVEPGQDLIFIARLYAVSVEELAELNGMSPGDKVEVGRRLRIP